MRVEPGQGVEESGGLRGGPEEDVSIRVFVPDVAPPKSALVPMVHRWHKAVQERGGENIGPYQARMGSS